MPLKRKTPSASVQESPSKRRTRSSGPLIETQPEPRTPTRRAGNAGRANPAESASPTKTRSKLLERDNSRSSLKENEDDVNTESSEDEVVASPTQPRVIRASRAGKAQMIVQIESTRRRPVRSLLSKFETSKREEERELPKPKGPPSKPQTTSAVVFPAVPLPPPVSPTKKSVASAPPASPSRLPLTLPPSLRPCLNTQRRTILRALQNPPDVDTHETEEDEDDTPTNDVAFGQLMELLKGTVMRDEGNSCLLIGPRGSGKSRMIERCFSSLPNRPIIIHLSGWVQHNDRLAMREIAHQLTQQTGKSFLSDLGEDEESHLEDETNPFIERDVTVSLPPPSHLPALISVLPTLSRPTIVVLDGFDLFALHARQALLYCLLDTVQSCQIDQGHKGVAVVGVTTRIDTINLLEKRVKSRFSGRMIRSAPPRTVDNWISIARATLCADCDDTRANSTWNGIWVAGVEKFLGDQAVVDRLSETFEWTRDARMLTKLLMAVVLQLTPSSPFPSITALNAATAAQRSRPRFAFLHAFPYPATCLLIAAMHSQTAGHDIITFEMLYDRFHTQVRASTAAPVHVDGGSIGMVSCTREVLMSAFEQLVQRRVFVSVAPPSTAIAKEFVRYRCTVDRAEVKRAVDTIGQTNLKKWFAKAG